MLLKREGGEKMLKKKRNDAGSWQTLSSLNPGAGEMLAG